MKEPSIKLISFACPHCSAFTRQTWYNCHVDAIRDKEAPFIASQVHLDDVMEVDVPEEAKTAWREYLVKSERAMPFSVQDAFVRSEQLHNVFFSRCEVCDDWAVWIHERLLYPAERHGPEPNSDLPDDIKGIYNEARSILNLSPTGAAALLRLAIQHLCIELGEDGKRINDDIASLVQKGLSEVVQQALDVVRVVGNEAVHPGEIDLNDSRDVALELFILVNEIADQMLTRPKRVKRLYDGLPESKKDAIARRDGKAK